MSPPTPRSGSWIRRTRYLAGVLILLLPAVLISPARPILTSQAAATPATITVDGSTTLKAYPARAPFTSNYQPDFTAASGEFTGTAERHGVNAVYLLNQAQFNAAHPGGAACGSPGSDCGEAEYNWGERIDSQIDFLTHPARAPSTMVEIIFQTPDWLQSVPGNIDSPPNDVNAYGKIAADIWHHFSLRVPDITKVSFEVWNEPDGFSGATMSVSQYTSLYTAVAGAMKQAASAFGSKVVVGGCACATLNASGLNFVQQWLQGTSPGLVDFVSWHEYADQFVSTDWNRIITEYPAHLKSTVASVRSYAQTSLAKSVPLLITEWNLSASNVNGMNTNALYETPFIGLMTSLSLANRLDGIDFFTNGGPDTGQVANGFYLLDASNEIAPWAWVNYLFDRSLGMTQAFNLVSSTSTDPVQTPTAFRLADGSYGVSLVNGGSTSVTDTVTLTATGLPDGPVTVHQYLVDATHAVTPLPDLAASAAGGTVTLSALVSSMSVTGFSLGPGAGPAVHLPGYRFHAFSEDFTGYGAAGSTSVAPPANNHYSMDYTNWVSTGPDSANLTQRRGQVATAASDGLTFVDSWAGPSTNALKVFGATTSYVRSGSYHLDWTVPPQLKVDLIFQADWAGGGQLVLAPDRGSPSGNPLGSPAYLALQVLSGSMTLRSKAGQVGGSFAFTPTAKQLSSWRLLVDGSNAEVDQFAAGDWHPVIGPAAHNLPQTPTGMEAGLIYLGVGSGSNYWANLSAGTPLLQPRVSAGCSPPTPLFADRFDQDPPGSVPQGWSVAGANPNWSVRADDGGHVYEHSGGPGFTAAGDLAWRDYRLTVEVRPAGGRPEVAGVDVRVNGPADRYSVRFVDGTALSFGRMASEGDLPARWTELGRVPFRYDGRSWHRADIKAVGSFFTVTVDGAQRLTVRDPALDHGRIGLDAVGPVRYRNVGVSSTC